MTRHITTHRGGFSPGRTAITSCEDSSEPTGIGVSVFCFDAGAHDQVTPTRETAWLLMNGRIDVTVGSERRTFVRNSLFDDLPSALHVSAGTRVAFACQSDVEMMIFETENPDHFAPRSYGPTDVRDERRGKGQVRDAALRLVRTVFDRGNAPPESRLVLGEVVTLPGRWSSYPPHHHPQPELYHYRFDRPEGFGLAQLGEQAVLVRQFDTLRILPPDDHAQTAAPGYAMYYAWVIRHLPDAPYTVPEFSAPHRWTLEPTAQTWWPKDLAADSDAGAERR